MRAGQSTARRTPEHSFIVRTRIPPKTGKGENFARFLRGGATAPLGTASVGNDSTVLRILGLCVVSVAAKIDDRPRTSFWTEAVIRACTDRQTRARLIATGLACAMLGVSTQGALSSACKPNHFRAPYFIKTMGPCVFDPATLSFAGVPAEQAKCLMRGMDHSRNLAPPMETLPAPLAERVGADTGLPSREALSTVLSNENLEWDFAAYLWQPVSRASDNDPNAPMARYFVIHDTSGPYYGRRSFPDDIDTSRKINSLNGFRCSDGWGKAHVVINRSGGMLLSHELAVPWRETKFEQAANFAGALKGLFLHTELIQPRRGAHNDAQSPNPGFTTAQYDRQALLYVIASVRSGHWLIPAFHAALDAEIRNGHDDPLNFSAESFADSLQRLIDKLACGVEIAAAPPGAAPPVPWGEVDAAPAPNYSVTAPSNPATMTNLPASDANAETTPDTDRPAAHAAEAEPKSKTENEGRSEPKTISAEHCQTRFIKGHRRRVCRTDVAESRERGKHAHAVRAVDRRVSRQGARAWHHAGDLRARHARGKTRHSRA
jgi:hypothetical protein